MGALHLYLLLIQSGDFSALPSLTPGYTSGFHFYRMISFPTRRLVADCGCQSFHNKVIRFNLAITDRGPIKYQPSCSQAGGAWMRSMARYFKVRWPSGLSRGCVFRQPGLRSLSSLPVCMPLDQSFHFSQPPSPSSLMWGQQYHLSVFSWMAESTSVCAK